jgi:hypothetical protein
MSGDKKVVTLGKLSPEENLLLAQAQEKAAKDSRFTGGKVSVRVLFMELLKEFMEKH